MKTSMKRCLNCNLRPAQKSVTLGWIYCKACIKKHQQINKLNETIELTTDEIKTSRKEYKKDILQPFRSGQLSREYAKAYPQKVKEMIKEGSVTVDEVRKSKNTWLETSYYKED